MSKPAYTTVHRAYLSTLNHVLTHGQPRAPRGLPTLELTGYAFVVLSPRFESIVTRDGSRNRVIENYTAREMDLYKRGELSAAAWASEASKFWEEIANPDGTVNSNYGHLLMHDRSAAHVCCEHNGEPTRMTQWEWCLDSIRRDRDTRQAVFHINQPRHQWIGVKDFPCTMYGLFRVVNDELDLVVHMRSNDVVRGLAYDMPWWVWCLEEMAKELELPVGRYEHHSDSMHVYRSDAVKAHRMLGREIDETCVDEHGRLDLARGLDLLIDGFNVDGARSGRSSGNTPNAVEED